MINRLRKKIFWIIQLSLSTVLLCIILLFTFFAYRNTITSSTMVMDRLGGRDNKQPKEDNIFEDKSLEEKDIDENNFEERNIEGVYRIDVKNNIASSKIDNLTEELKDYAVKVSNKKSDMGYIGNYIYKVRDGINGKEVTLIKSEETIQNLKNTIAISLIVGSLGIIIIYIIAKRISITIVKPVEASFEKQKQFVSDASHELKTPLAVIEANADVLQNKVGENKWLTYIQNEIQSMNKLVNDLLILARMEKTNNVNWQKFNLSKEVQISVSVFESIIYEKKIKLDTNICEEIEFNGDKDDIKHIISIILDNAIKHTAENNKIIINLLKEKNEIKLEIKNQGEPIPEDEIEKIFERFYRVNKARSRSEKRYGLGLSIAKEIVEKYNGTIFAVSKDGYTSFVVKI